MSFSAEAPLAQLTECIRESKRPIGFLLGAGCAKSIWVNGSPLVPDTRDMTEIIRGKIDETNISDCWKGVVEQIVEGENDDIENIEEVLSQVRGMIRFSGKAGISGLEKVDLRALEKRICREIGELVDVSLPSEGSGYRGLTTWLGSIEREEPVEIFTTNYDLLMEQALEENSIPYHDGFVGGYKPFFEPYSIANDELPPRWLRLWKIHGSINWVSGKRHGKSRVWRSDSAKAERAMIHPSHLKYDESRKMPYRALIDRLSYFLSKPSSVLCTVGYSFGDEHLNEVLLQALKGNPSSAVFAFMFECLDESKKARKLSERQSNLSLFARDAGVLGTEKREWRRQESEPESKRRFLGTEWVESDTGRWEERCVLGDFEKFGRFFQSTTARR